MVIFRGRRDGGEVRGRGGVVTSGLNMLMHLQPDPV